jgi:integrase
LGGFLHRNLHLEQMKVGIQNKKGWLILVWNDGNRRTMATGIRADIAGAKALAQKIATRIELDFLQRDEGRYDRTLLAYKPRVLGKTATEISAPELFDRFTKYQAKAKGLAQSGIKSRYIALRKMLEKVLNVPANSIRKREAEGFADACATTLQSDTAKARLSLLVACWDWAKGKYHVADENPFKGLADRFRSQPKKLKRPFSVAEVLAILDGFRSSRYYSHYADYASFLLGIGTRPGEASGLIWENVASDFTSVYICQSFSRGVVGDTKTKQSRTVNLSPSIVAMLKRRNEAQQPQASDFVFFTPTRLPINDRNFRRRAWTNVLKAAGVDYRSPYKCRSTAASHSIASGVDYISVAKALGNSPKVLHDHYLDIIESRSIFVDFD